MGHQRLGKLLAYRLGDRQLSGDGRHSADLADHVTEGGRVAVQGALNDPVVVEVLWWLIRLPRTVA